MLFSLGGSHAMRLDSSGRLLLGTTASQSIYGSQAAFQVSGTGFATSTISLRRDQDNHLAGGIVFAKSRGSQGGVTVVQSGDSLGSLIFAGADGTDLTSTGAEIEVEVDGTPGSNDIPGRILFKTTPDGSAGPTERMRIDSSGFVGLGSSNPTYKLTLIGSGNTDSGLYLYNNTGAEGIQIVPESNGNCRIYSSTNDALALGTNGTDRLTISAAGNATFTGTVSDSKGDLRKIPINAQSSSYTLVSSDAGKTIRTTAGVTVPAGVFYEGEAITIFNDSGSDITITQGSNQTMYNAADAATGNRTLAGRGLATVLCFDNNEFVISGAGLS
jgi:hypothetical protein